MKAKQRLVSGNIMQCNLIQENMRTKRRGCMLWSHYYKGVYDLGGDERTKGIGTKNESPIERENKEKKGYRS